MSKCNINRIVANKVGYNKLDKTIYPLTIKAGETATLKVSDTPKVTDTLIELKTTKLTPEAAGQLNMYLKFRFY